jgi:hypothetical protein
VIPNQLKMDEFVVRDKGQTFDNVSFPNGMKAFFFPFLSRGVCSSCPPALAARLYWSVLILHITLPLHCKGWHAAPPPQIPYSLWVEQPLCGSDSLFTEAVTRRPFRTLAGDISHWKRTWTLLSVFRVMCYDAVSCIQISQKEELTSFLLDIIR